MPRSTFPIYPSLSEKLGALEFEIWDKDMLRKEYLGEFALPPDEWFKRSKGMHTTLKIPIIRHVASYYPKVSRPAK
jgi:hypothetical protein